MSARARARTAAGIAFLGAALAGVAPGGAGWAPGVACAAEEEAWRAELDEVCSKTQDAMALSVAELESLIARCDELKPRIDALDEPRRKVFGKRLTGCRELYRYVLDFKTANAGS